MLDLARHPDAHVQVGGRLGAGEADDAVLAQPLEVGETTYEMYLAERYEGVTPEQVQQNTGFALDVSRAALTEPPTAEELRILRDEVDPQRLILG